MGFEKPDEICWFFPDKNNLKTLILTIAKKNIYIARCHKKTPNVATSLKLEYDIVKLANKQTESKKFLHMEHIRTFITQINSNV